MTLTREHVMKALDIYIRAWEEQNDSLIVTIFSADATYHERVLRDPPIPDREAIRRYWQEKVIGAQSNINCHLLNLYIDTDADTAIAEWEAEFDDLDQGERKRMREAAFLTFGPDGLITSLREYWASEVLAALPS